MPATLNYPGVYIEEVPSGVRAISGVATSIAAFAGWLARGDTDEPTLVQSWQDFERQCGGLDSRTLLGHAVYHFFANGGQQAYIVRLVADDVGTAETTLDGKLKLVARNPGEWAKDYAVATKIRADDASRFRLSVFYVPPGTTQEIPVEVFENLSMSESDRRFAVNVLEDESSVVRGELVGTPTAPPSDTASPSPKLNGGADLDGTVLLPDAGAFETKLEAGGGSAGVNLLDKTDLFNLLCVPGETTDTVVAQLQKFCRDRRAFLIVDCARGATFDSLKNGPPSITGSDAINSAFYFPWVKAPDPLKENRLAEFPPSGFVAGLYAKTDSSRGVWKAPAGIDASLTGVSGLKEVLTDAQNGTLNVQAINCLRRFDVYGNVIWGARTLRGNNEIGSEWKYVPIRRLALFLEESLYRGTQWVVFEPNDEPLWAQIRLNIGAFMQGLFRQGAFQGRSPREAYYVKCDGETTTQADRDLGVVNILIGFAPLKPAEFVVIKIQQMAGQTQAEESVMAQFSVNAQRFDPYKNFKFRVKWDGRFVAGVSKIGALKRSTEVVEHREGGDPSLSRKSPGRTSYEALTLERGVTHDPEFEKWANKVWNFGSGLGAEVSLKDFRKDIIVEMYNESGQLVTAYKVYRCWVSEFQALPELDANANAVAIQTLKLENEGWERDYDVTEPAEPTFDEPA